MRKYIGKLLFLLVIIITSNGCSKKDIYTDKTETSVDEITSMQEEYIDESNSIQEAESAGINESTTAIEKESSTKAIKPSEFEYEEMLGVLEEPKKTFTVYTKEGYKMANANTEWYSSFVLTGKCKEGWYSVVSDGKELYINSKDINTDIYIFDFSLVSEEYYSINNIVIYAYPNTLAQQGFWFIESEDKCTVLGVDKGGKWAKVSFELFGETEIGYTLMENLTKTRPLTEIEKKVKEYKEQGYIVYEVNTREEAEKIIYDCIKYDDYVFIGKGDAPSSAAYMLKDIIQEKYYPLFEDGMCWGISTNKAENDITWSEFLLRPWSQMSNGEEYYRSLGYDVSRIYTEDALDLFIKKIKAGGKYAVYVFNGSYDDTWKDLEERISEWNVQNSGKGLRAKLEMDSNSYNENHCSPQHNVYLITIESQ